MEKKNKVILIFLIFLTLSVVSFCVYSVADKTIGLTDAIKFKNEYKELNNIVNKTNGKRYASVNISEDNTVKYMNEKEIVSLLESGTGVVYFGFKTCPWCRSLVSSLTKVAKETNETIYYLDIENIRSNYEVIDGKINNLKEGSSNYYKILDLLDEQLEDYILVDENGKSYNVGEKRLFAPTLVAIKNGKVMKIHVGTVETQKSGYDELTKEESAELENIIIGLINSKNEISCTDKKC